MQLNIKYLFSPTPEVALSEEVILHILGPHVLYLASIKVIIAT